MIAFVNKKHQVNKRSLNLFSLKVITILYVSKAVFHQEKKWLKLRTMIFSSRIKMNIKLI